MRKDSYSGAALAASFSAILGSALFAACAVATKDGDTPSPEDGGPAALTLQAAPTAGASASSTLPPQLPKLRADGLRAGVVPFRGGVHAEGTAPACSSPKLQYFGGPVVMNPVVVPINWNGNVNATVVADMPQFFSDVLASRYWQGLEEYGTVGLAGGTNQAILGGTVSAATPAGVTISPALCPTTTSTKACKVTDAQIQTELVRQIGLATIPAPTLDCTSNPETIYMISFPPYVSVVGPDGAGDSCVQFCAYHNTGTYGASSIPLIYGVLMDDFTGACSGTGCGNGTAIQNVTSVASHELAEAATDPDIGLDTAADYAKPAGWGDNNNQCGEIADICDSASNYTGTVTVSGRTWTVQQLWSNQTGVGCTAEAPILPVCTGTTLTGCRKCACGDTGNACTGAAAVCETTSTNVLFGACEQCTSKDSSACVGSAATCAQSSTPAQDDICACTPATTCPAGDNCGTVSNGCGGTVSCGTCTAPQSCGGASKANQCGCTPVTSCPAGDNCGTISNGCGATVTCGTCTAPQSCGGGAPSNPNQCGCTPLIACPAADDCGTIPNGCGGVVACGTCGVGSACSGNSCVSTAVDAGTGGKDAGASGGADAGSSGDAGASLDAGLRNDSGASTDAGNGGNDAGTGSDASAREDAGGSRDAGSALDASAARDAGMSDDASTPSDDGGSEDSGAPVETDDSGLATGTEDASSGTSNDASEGGTGDGQGVGSSNGCGCEVVQSRSAPPVLWSAIGAFVVLGGARMRRRTKRVTAAR